MISKINFSLKTALAALAISLDGLPFSLEGAPATILGNASQYINVACDDSGNAIAAHVDNVGSTNDTLNANYFSTGTWGSAVMLNSTPAIIFANFPTPLAMDATGTGLNLWTQTPDAITSYLDSASFTPPNVWSTPAPSPLAINGIQQSVAMNGSGQGLGLWGNFITPDTYASFFSGGVWAAPVAIGTGNFSTNGKASYSLSGNASAVWSDRIGGLSTNIYANNYDGVTWQGVQTLELIAPTFVLDPDAGIDAAGNTLAVWINDPDKDVITSTYSGGSWSALQTLSTGSGNKGSARIAVAPAGTAVAVWTDSGDNIKMCIYDGFSWGIPTDVVGSSQQPRVAMDANGNAVIGWVEMAFPYNIYFAHLPSGESSVDSVTLLFTAAPDIPPYSFEVAISALNQTAFAVWSETFGLGEGSRTWGTYYQFVPPTPTGFQAQVCTNRLTNQYDCSVIISWDPSTDPDVVSYNLYKNDIFLANVLAEELPTYTDAPVPCSEINTYTIESVNSNGETSPLATDTVDICTPIPCG